MSCSREHVRQISTPQHRRGLIMRLGMMVLATAWLFGQSMLAPANALDTLKLAVGAPNNWDTSIPEIGKRAGIFAKHGLEIDILYTQGGGETLQAVISGSVDIGVAAGIHSVMGAFSKGAPIRILSAGT